MERKNVVKNHYKTKQSKSRRSRLREIQNNNETGQTPVINNNKCYCQGLLCRYAPHNDGNGNEKNARPYTDFALTNSLQGNPYTGFEEINSLQGNPYTGFEEINSLQGNPYTGFEEINSLQRNPYTGFEEINFLQRNPYTGFGKDNLFHQNHDHSGFEKTKRPCFTSLRITKVNNNHNNNSNH
jgi:hypothetical protein